MYFKISNMFRTLICAVFSTTINKLSLYILLSDNYTQSALFCLGRFLIHSAAKEIVKYETRQGASWHSRAPTSARQQEVDVLSVIGCIRCPLMDNPLQAQQRLQAFPPVMPPACCGAQKATEQ